MVNSFLYVVVERQKNSPHEQSSSAKLYETERLQAIRAAACMSFKPMIVSGDSAR